MGGRIPSPLPRHVAIIMDGNGRWARKRGLPRVMGHRAGVRAVKKVVRAAREIGIEVLTLYAFSKENWARPRAEVEALMGLLYDYLEGELEEMLSNDIALKVIGDPERLPERVRKKLFETIEKTSQGRGMTLVLALSYGGRDELVRAFRRMAEDLAAGRLEPAGITEETISARLDTRELPDPDLIIRTSGEERLSNFLIYQGAYAELYFTKTLWPDFDRRALLRALEDYAKRERRFGKTSEQLKGEGDA